MLWCNIAVALVCIAMAYSGYIDPRFFAPAGILVMTMPTGLLFSGIMFIATATFARRQIWIPIATVFICSPAIITWSPLNIMSASNLRTTDKSDSLFTVVTYNVHGLLDSRNALEYLCNSNADIACLQECPSPGHRAKSGIDTGLIDTLRQKFPYIISPPSGICIMSRTPVRSVPNPITHYGSFYVSTYTTSIEGHQLTLVDVHLESIGLTDDDKEFYQTLTHRGIERGEIGKVRHRLGSKLLSAFRERASQAESIQNYIDTIKGNLILCGDFNDLPGSFASRTIGKNMRDAYADAGLGPAPTFHAYRMYFRIDQMFYRGDMQAVYSRRVVTPGSDHYPLATTFRWLSDYRSQTDYKE